MRSRYHKEHRYTRQKLTAEVEKYRYFFLSMKHVDFEQAQWREAETKLPRDRNNHHDRAHAFDCKR